MPGFDATLNIHPVLIHFPIALTLTAIPLVIYSLFAGKPGVMETAAIMIYFAAAAALVAAITGLRAEEMLGHDSPNHDLVHIHKELMLWYTGLIITLAVVNYFTERNGAPGWVSHWSTKAIRMILLLSAAAVLIVGADRGALLVFGHGIGTTYKLGEEGQGSIQMDTDKRAPDEDHAEHEHEH